jgi:glutamine synthetase
LIPSLRNVILSERSESKDLFPIAYAADSSHTLGMTDSSIIMLLVLPFGLKAVVASEIEFYLPQEPDDAFWRGLAVEKFEREKGRGQWEVALPMGTPEQAVERLQKIKAELQAKGADFSAKPFPDQPGSGLHVHVHLEKNGQNVFYKKDAEISDALKWSIGGLLATLPENMSIFAPTPESRARYARDGQSPTTISWGANNRTCAIRLPDVGAPYRHIEHRVAGADADPEAVIAAVLRGIHYGLMHQCEPGPQIYGDASLEMYGLKKLIG